MIDFSAPGPCPICGEPNTNCTPETLARRGVHGPELRIQERPRETVILAPITPGEGRAQIPGGDLGGAAQQANGPADDSETVFSHQLGMRELRKLGARRHVPGYRDMRRAELVAALEGEV